MATLVLSAAGSALGGSLGGSLAGLSTLALGKAVGATLGSVIDQRILGLGAEPVESGKVEQFRIMGSSEGAALPRCYGRNRVAGQLIWSSRFLESVTSENVGGKGGGSTVREFSYSVSVAVALCEGEVCRIGRIWADGQALRQDTISWRLYEGSYDQQPDPLITAIEGADQTPAFRGTAYVVIEDLDLAQFGNRIPQFSFEVVRRPDVPDRVAGRHPAKDIRAVALVPGTGEYSLATETVRFDRGYGDSSVANIHNDRGVADLTASLDQMNVELPEASAVSLVVSWFGTDLRCNRCQLVPAVEQNTEDATLAWTVAGQSRSEARVVKWKDERPVFGGTPTDQSVVQSIQDMNSRNLRVMFYPFILMDILTNNGLADPWSGQNSQPEIPWRGRITLSSAPGISGTTDQTGAAAEEVDAFFGRADLSDFSVSDGKVVYSGPEEWGYRRFILHYAHLCALAGGVSAFCVGSELRGLTQIRSNRDTFPAVSHLVRLAAEVKGILGESTKVGYAADWSEYFGYHPVDGSEDVFFHLDELWGHRSIDFVGIDNYMPLSDWRDGADHADVGAGSIYDLDYLRSGVGGGEGYDWYYSGPKGREAQHRLPISDGAYGEDWVFRYKDIRNWWSHRHFNRIGGVRSDEATDWVPKGKPVWFTELGCPAIDKGANQPNVFCDPKSSESAFPYSSNGSRDDFIQFRYLQATYAYWGNGDNNPDSDVYTGKMIDLDNAFAWAWDARPWPDFPNRLQTWSDGGNFELGHWLNGRMLQASLPEVVAEICIGAGLTDINVDELYGVVTGYSLDGVQTARQGIQPLMVAYGIDAVCDEGKLAFRSRGIAPLAAIAKDECVAGSKLPVVGLTRSPSSDLPGRITLGFVRADLDYEPGAVEVALCSDRVENTAQSSLPIVFEEGKARAIAERWLAEGQLSQESISFSVPFSLLSLMPGDTISVQSGGKEQLFRIDRLDEHESRKIEAVLVDPDIYGGPDPSVRRKAPSATLPATPVHATFLDLPLLTGDEVPHTPHIAVSCIPWSGDVAIYSSSGDSGYSLLQRVRSPATLGKTLDPLQSGLPGLWMNSSLSVRLARGHLQSRSQADVLNGANVAAICALGSEDWEVIQFCDAVLEGPNQYRLSGLLRGQAGTDAIAPESYQAGAQFVLMDGSVEQVELTQSAREIERHFRIGPAGVAYTDDSYVREAKTFQGIGLRPYSPAYVRAELLPSGDVHIDWIRRSRVGGDNWTGFEIPLGEERELYHIKIGCNGALIREAVIKQPFFTYTFAHRISDGREAHLEIAVAQVSQIFGVGPYRRINVHAHDS